MGNRLNTLSTPPHTRHHTPHPPSLPLPKQPRLKALQVNIPQQQQQCSIQRGVYSSEYLNSVSHEICITKIDLIMHIDISLFIKKIWEFIQMQSHQNHIQKKKREKKETHTWSWSKQFFCPPVYLKDTVYSTPFRRYLSVGWSLERKENVSDYYLHVHF